MSTEANQPAREKHGFSGLQVLSIVLIAVLVTVALGFWAIRATIYPSDFKPVRLGADEQQVLDAKLWRLESGGGRRQRVTPEDQGDLVPEPYTESDANRRVNLSERELNGLIANNKDLASKVAIDLADNHASAKVLIPIDPGFPVLGGKTLKVNAGLKLAYANGKPVVVLKGISVMGVPVPNAWLGNLKNVDLVEQFGTDGGFWKVFSDGVEEIKVEEGQLTVRLRE